MAPLLSWKTGEKMFSMILSTSAVFGANADDQLYVVLKNVWWAFKILYFHQLRFTNTDAWMHTFLRHLSFCALSVFSPWVDIMSYRKLGVDVSAGPILGLFQQVIHLAAWVGIKCILMLYMHIKQAEGGKLEYWRNCRW